MSKQRRFECKSFCVLTSSVFQGLDAPFFYEARWRECGISGRVLWSEPERNLAQKLIESLQNVSNH